jgi:hypothetical protein
MKRYFESDADFSSAFLRGYGQNSLDALFDDGLGTDYMFDRLAADVNTTERMSLYDLIEKKDISKLKMELSRILPTGQDGAAALRREVVKNVITRVTQEVSDDKPDQVRKLASFVKDVFVVDEELLDPIPQTPHRRHEEELKKYLLVQVNKWISSRKEDLAGRPGFNWLVNEEEIYPFLEALATIDMDSIIDLLKTEFWNHSQKVSRTFLAMVLNNCFLWGDYERRINERRTDAYNMLCAPFVERLSQLSTISYAQEGARPPALDGDEELSEIVRDLQLI